MTLETDSESLQTLVEGMNDAVLVVDLDGNYLAVNDAAIERLGYTREELLDRGPRDLTTPDEAAKIADRIASIDEEETLVFETVQQTSDGTEIPVEMNASRITYEGEPAILSVARDITERKERQQQLRRREERFRTMFETHSAPMLLVDPDTGTIQNANEAASEFYGYPELTGMGIQDINRLTPEEVARERRRAEREQRNHFVFEHELADGDVRTVEVHSSPITVEDGELLFSIIHDITERIEYERELKRHKELVENVPMGIYRNTPGENGEFVEVNPAMVEMFDADSEAHLLDQSVSDLYVDAENRRDFSETMVGDGLITEREIHLETLTGETFWGEVTAIATEIDGETYFDGAIQDITERREYERRLEEQRDNLEVLNQVVRHDIRNDLQLVLAYLELLTEYVDDDDGREYIETALESAENAVDLTQTARDMADVMSQTETDCEPTALQRVLERELDEMRSSHAEAAITVEGTLPDVSVLANDMLASVVRNLVHNAIQHNDKDVSEIVLSVTERDDHVVVHVADNGPGIPDDQKEAIFGKGEKGLGSEGTGIGLYLVNTLVEQYGGDVWVADRAADDPAGSPAMADDRAASAESVDGAVFNVKLRKAESE